MRTARTPAQRHGIPAGVAGAADQAGADCPLASKLGLGNSLITAQSTGEYLAEVRAHARAPGLPLQQRLPLPVLLASAATGLGASPAATGLGLFVRGRMRP